MTYSWIFYEIVIQTFRKWVLGDLEDVNEEYCYSPQYPRKPPTLPLGWLEWRVAFLFHGDLAIILSHDVYRIERFKEKI